MLPLSAAARGAYPGQGFEECCQRGPLIGNPVWGVRFVLEDWRKLTTSDHFYYMCTKYWADGDVPKYFSPYDSPYDGYINFMNVLDNLRARIARLDLKPETVRG